jgi:diaminohydroxyphosphoribosylaminopyrimidine deaminase/5-amino-6-(5-phosphoribosylamino)uracil reductase
LTDESYIKLAIEIARKGTGHVSPNPLVGCVIVKNNSIIGAGYHEKYGENHAEVNAINTAKESVEGSTLYVNLEPCSHTGKTPPCVNKIIENKIRRVVIGTLDMNPLVCGKGVRKLKAAGIEVKVGVLEKECMELNKFFFKYIAGNLPFVTLKAAQTLDGKIADCSGDSKWITTVHSRRYVHLLRSKYDAVLVGSGTVSKDDPSLTVRYTEGRNPYRVLIDSKLALSSNHKLFKNNQDNKFIILTSKRSVVKKRKIASITAMGIKILYVKEARDGRLDLKNALSVLAKNKIASVLVEGGSEVFTSFIRSNLFDDILLFVSPKMLGCGLPVIGQIGVKSIKKALKLKIDNFEKIGDDLLIELIK